MREPSKSNPRTPGAREGRSVDQLRDAPDGVMRERGPSDRMRLPHERDESSASSSTAAGKSAGQPEIPGQHDLMRRASEDIASDQQDTDCRNRNPGQSDCPPRPAAAQGRDAVSPVEHERAKPGAKAGETGPHAGERQ